MAERWSGAGRNHAGLLGRPTLLTWCGAVLLLAAAVVAGVWRRHELAQAFALIARVRVPQLMVAVAAEALSMACFAAVPRRLLRAGGVRWSLRRTGVIVVAANAVAGALPGGAALAGAWTFRQLHRRGVDPALAAAVLVCAGALSALGLGIVIVVGLATLGATGAAAVLRPVADLLGLALLVGLVLLVLSRLAGFRAALRRCWDRAGRRSARVDRAERALARVAEQIRSLRPGPRTWLRPAVFALLNWLFDVACLIACLWALGVGVPWHGILLAYGLTQIPGSLRLTPGSLGVIEASLSVLLVWSGLAPGSAIAATLLYRALSFWALQPVGWACWIGVTLHPDRPGAPDPPPPPHV
ncbi:YbhN family protein [Streptomyces sp. NPDC014733]|uniref:lysylphosphatidylglycerol synthase transmembrane domain-containing protein n=1 Tax=Streptomyces sp. NPDC014733 TaxID=3364885 RepID=UPI0036FCE103